MGAVKQLTQHELTVLKRMISSPVSEPRAEYVSVERELGVVDPQRGTTERRRRLEDPRSPGANKTALRRRLISARSRAPVASSSGSALMRHKPAMCAGVSGRSILSALRSRSDRRA